VHDCSVTELGPMTAQTCALSSVLALKVKGQRSKVKVNYDHVLFSTYRIN